MSTFFLRKKHLSFGLLGLVSILFVFSSFLYTIFVGQRQAVDVNSSFYLLVSGETNIEAGAEFVKLEGGAGYLFTTDEGEYIVLSIYLREDKGETVLKKMEESGEKVQLMPIHIKKLYFDNREKEKQNTYLSGLNLIEEYLSVLENCIEILDKGGTQESIKRILSPMEKQIYFLAQDFQEKYDDFSRLCQQIAIELQKINNQIIYTRDLRYLSCQMVDGYLGLCKQFFI